MTRSTVRYGLALATLVLAACEAVPQTAERSETPAARVSWAPCDPESSALAEAFDRIDRLLAETREREEILRTTRCAVLGPDVAFPEVAIPPA